MFATISHACLTNTATFVGLSQSCHLSAQFVRLLQSLFITQAFVKIFRCKLKSTILLRCWLTCNSCCWHKWSYFIAFWVNVVTIGFTICYAINHLCNTFTDWKLTQAITENDQSPSYMIYLLQTKKQMYISLIYKSCNTLILIGILEYILTRIFQSTWDKKRTFKALVILYFHVWINLPL